MKKKSKSKNAARSKAKEIVRSKPGSLGELYDVIDAAFPEHRTRLGHLDVYAIAEKMDVAGQAVYIWFKNEKLPQRRVAKLVELSKGRLNVDALYKFIFA